jgi:hypothetical protein
MPFSGADSVLPAGKSCLYDAYNAFGVSSLNWAATFVAALFLSRVKKRDAMSRIPLADAGFAPIFTPR